MKRNTKKDFLEQKFKRRKEGRKVERDGENIRHQVKEMRWEARRRAREDRKERDSKR